MKVPALASLVLFLFGGAAARDELGYALEGEVTLLRTFVAERAEELVAVALEVEEEELQRLEDVSYRSSSTETVVARDRIEEVEDGRPTDFTRTFVELEQTSSVLAGDEELESTNTSDLEDVVLRFLWDDEDERYYVELEDDQADVDEDVLEKLTADLDLFPFLPEDEVSEGDEWEVDHTGYLTLMWPGGLVGWYDPDSEDGPSEFGEAIQAQIVENLEGDGTVTFEEVRDEDGVRVAVLAVELSVWTEAETDMEDAGQIGFTDERDLEGTLLWDLEHGHLHSASFETDVEWSRATTGPVEGPEGQVVVLTQRELFEGTIEYTATIERE